MFLAKVIGNVVATQKDPSFRGMKLLLIQPYINRDRVSWPPSGSSVVAVDSVGAGLGECVLFTQGSSARLTPAPRTRRWTRSSSASSTRSKWMGPIVEKP